MIKMKSGSNARNVLILMLLCLVIGCTSPIAPTPINSATMQTMTLHFHNPLDYAAELSYKDDPRYSYGFDVTQDMPFLIESHKTLEVYPKFGITITEIKFGKLYLHSLTLDNPVVFVYAK